MRAWVWGFGFVMQAECRIRGGDRVAGVWIGGGDAD